MNPTNDEPVVDTAFVAGSSGGFSGTVRAVAKPVAPNDVTIAGPDVAWTAPPLGGWGMPGRRADGSRERTKGAPADLGVAALAAAHGGARALEGLGVGSMAPAGQIKAQEKPAQPAKPAPEPRRDEDEDYDEDEEEEPKKAKPATKKPSR